MLTTLQFKQVKYTFFFSKQISLSKINCIYKMNNIEIRSAIISSHTFWKYKWSWLKDHTEGSTFAFHVTGLGLIPDNQYGSRIQPGVIDPWAQDQEYDLSTASVTQIQKKEKVEMHHKQIPGKTKSLGK